MEITKNRRDLSKYLAQIKDKIGFVPTMGALHAGHIKLIKSAKDIGCFTAVSIFVNPLQFNDPNDFKTYPQNLDTDLDICRQNGVDLVFCPGLNDIYEYNLDNTFKIEPPLNLTSVLCGLGRPGHFTGVATIVLKLFNLVKPNKVFMGLKDYQQYLIIKRMCQDLFYDIEVIGIDTVREESGLALSSRNKLLKPDDLKKAPILYKTLVEIKNELLTDKNIGNIIRIKRDDLSQFGINVEYLTALNANDLSEVNSFSVPTLLAIAAKFDKIRLIDNIIAYP